MKGGGRTATPAHAVFELKHKVVLSLNKLSDRDTYKIGAEELEKITEGLTPEGIAPFLSCIIGSSGGGGGRGNGFVTLVKPFFEALGEQNRYVQTGSALCLARVIDEAADPPIALVAQMLARVVKLLKNQHFMAKPAVIGLIRSIVQAGGASTEHAQHLALTSITEALKCSDWTTRKAASVALAGIAVSCGSAFGHMKTSCICSLESCRFDKVKPVRDAVVHALQCWKALSSWKSINDHMRAGDLDSAYEEALSSGDVVILFELMNTTGPVLEKLSDDVAKNILDILPRKFLNHRFISSMIPWVQQVSFLQFG
ncbi:Microtubule-associated protein TORTIFOLIA1 [Platanthera guangdongensis]|uniref:Microtubule-associated protein TORTIFOLIA1 n=1 Tax=Platanthera guangdongensis TaxID=2320717 RepID=A0ABR2MKN6_9ASPA